jgi:hypothetical protein
MSCFQVVVILSHFIVVIHDESNKAIRCQNIASWRRPSTWNSCETAETRDGASVVSIPGHVASAVDTCCGSVRVFLTWSLALRKETRFSITVCWGVKTCSLVNGHLETIFSLSCHLCLGPQVAYGFRTKHFVHISHIHSIGRRFSCVYCTYHAI